MTVPRDIRHPLFARWFDSLSRWIEPEVAQLRDELLAGLSGRVLEIGAGSGMNFRHYPPTVEQVVAIEPEPYLRTKAERAAEAAAIPISVAPGTAEELDLPDGSFDAIVASLVLCTVHEQRRALTELHRVLKRGGELRFFEHVRSPSEAKARVQSLADRTRVWPTLGGGCHCSRDTVIAIKEAGFRVATVRTVDVGPAWMLTNPHVLGRATS